MLNPQDKTTVDAIFAAVETQMDIPRGVIFSPRRTQRSMAARDVWCWVAFRRTHLTIRQIGSLIGKHHTTILRAVSRVDRGGEALAMARRVERSLKAQKAVAG